MAGLSADRVAAEDEFRAYSDHFDEQVTQKINKTYNALDIWPRVQIGLGLLTPYVVRERNDFSYYVFPSGLSPLQVGQIRDSIAKFRAKERTRRQRQQQTTPHVSSSQDNDQGDVAGNI